MSQATQGPPRRNNELLDSAEDFAVGVGRLGYGLLSLGLGLLPRQSRTHMHNAVRELSHAFAQLPRDFADVAGAAIEGWATETDTPAAPGAQPSATARVRRVRVADPVGTAVPVEMPIAPPITTLATGMMIAHIEFDPPGRDLDGEYVLLRNTADEAMDLTGWTLRDAASKHIYVFPSFTLAPAAEARLWTRAGTNDTANLYWGSRGAIWNNDGDTGTLADRSGTLVSSFSYAGNVR
jgi:Lamin Tail Domain